VPVTDPLLVRPFWLERQTDPASPDYVPGTDAAPVNVTHRSVTTLGTLAGPARAAVDPRGLVTPDHARWSLDWWVGAEDRWHVPARSRSVRQRLLDGTPVVETAMRVPGGDVLHRAYGFHSTELGPCIAVEIENRTAVPVALALAVRPYHPLGRTAVTAIAVDGPVVHVDGRPAVLLPRAPAEIRTGDGSGDVAGALLAGTGASDGARTADARVEDGGGGATVALVVPLAHTAVFRAVLPLVPPAPLAGARRRAAATAPLAYPENVPAAEQVAKGWRSQTGRGLRVELPDERLQQAVDAAVGHLLLAQGGEDVVAWPAGDVLELDDVARILTALDQWGFADEVGEVLGTWPERQGLDGAFASPAGRIDANAAALAAVAAHWRLTGDTDTVERLVGPLAKGAHWIEKRRTGRRPARDARAVGLLPESPARPGGGPPGTYLRDAAVAARALAGVAGALDAAGQPEVAADARRFAAALAADLGRTIAAVVPAGAALPATPSRGVDDGVVVNVDLFEPFGPLAAVPDDRVDATLDAIRARAADTGAVHQADGTAGLSPVLTAQLATVEVERGDRRALARLAWLLDAGGPTVVWPGAVHPRTGGGSWGRAHDPAATAAFLTLVRHLLVREHADGSGLAVCSLLPEDWRGQALDVRDAPTAFGRFSFSLRWHGDRPALLWELDPHPHVTGLALTAPGLDPHWSGNGLTGEALLAAVAPEPPAPSPGEPASGVDDGPLPSGPVEVPVTLAPGSGIRPAPPPGDQGESFS
jgi:hypothetical protein